MDGLEQVSYQNEIVIIVAFTDLQMAATYGKMLLEKNVQLQQELQDLQKVAEETTLENQVGIMLYTYGS